MAISTQKNILRFFCHTLMLRKKASKVGALIIASALIALPGFSAHANPADDKEKFQTFFTKKFPHIELNEFANGVYALDPESRAQWKSIEEFPPYEFAIEEGEALYKKPFITGRTYADCLPNGGIGLAHNYPRFDARENKVITLAQEINTCRRRNREEPLAWGEGELALILTYLVNTSRGEKIDITIQSNAATKAYEKGKKLYYTRTGQLNIACAHCHIDYSGKRIRADVLSPALGQTSHFPVYRARWGEVGTLHRRFAECTQLSRAKAYPLQSEAYNNLEYFLSYMSNGIELNGPGARK